MNPEQRKRVEELFQEALDLPETERGAFLQACDAELRAEVEALLSSYASVDAAFLDAPAVPALSPHAADDPDTPDDPDAPDTIGPYHLIRVLGEGGMGTVYLAEQEKPLQRRVALKLVKPGMDSREVIARFEAERQALASMDHPGIAQVYEAGTTERGRPYFVMEYVRGFPLVEYCDEHRLDVRQRVELMLQVCDAVQHAHQRGIIHRDLKPSNVLVAEAQDRPLPKVIDFGIAKATEPQIGGATLLTSHGQVLGTPEYMSPEQARLSNADVDTRTDVYSLGMLLYVLLAGTLPFSAQELRALDLETMLRRIREDEATRPSDRVAAGPGNAAEARRTTPDRLPRQLRGDLDWIVMKALEKDRDQRYPSVSGLAADLRRHLDDEPVSAGPPSAGYRVRKFARRHKAGVGSAALVALLLLGTSIVMSVQAGRIARERDRANEEAAMAQELSDFLLEMFEVAGPNESRGNTITAREILDRGASRIESRLDLQPNVAARFQEAMGAVYRSLGLFDQSKPFLVQALERRRSLLGDRHPETLVAAYELGVLFWNRSEYEDAETLLRETLEAQGDVLGMDDPATLETKRELGKTLWNRGRYDESESMTRSALEGLTRVLGSDHESTLSAWNNLAALRFSQGESREAEQHFRELLDSQRRVLGEDHPHVFTSMANLGTAIDAQGRRDEALEIWRRTFEGQRRVLGDDHQETLRTMNNIATSTYDPAERESLHVQVAATALRVLGADHQETLAARRNLAGFYARTGRLADAEQILRDILQVQGRVQVDDHPDVAITMNSLGVVCRMQERFGEAEPLLLGAMEIRVRTFGEDHPSTLTSASSLGSLYSLMERTEDAERLLTRAYEGRRRTLGADHALARKSRTLLADFLESQGRTEEAAVLRGAAPPLTD